MTAGEMSAEGRRAASREPFRGREPVGGRIRAFRAERSGADGKRGRSGGERSMVPPAEFRSYYGRPVVRPAVWHHDIAWYLFTGGLAAGSSLLAAGADATGRTGLRRATRLTSLAALG